ncbi:ABC transporter ATP-binding protein [Candidatus Marsarchaeota archaeon]|nr:ABC transporter ATP-binding protein [Candidatus Marsarchaeota archaeon]MCL5404805.1 ABC transporter ATP-binding protein [Candidatus Marsarchaeota archaeon]
MRPFVKVAGLTKRFGKGIALEKLSLDVKAGITVVLGPNGAGKSTLLRCMAGLYKPDSGSVEVLGKDPYYDSAVRGRIAFMPDNYGLYDFLSVRDNIRFFARLYGISYGDADKRLKETLSMLDASEYFNYKVGALSRGTKQKILLCKAVLNDPEVILLDEPTAFLDASSSDKVRSYLSGQAKAGKAIVFVTQRIDEATRFGSRIFMIRNGRKVVDTGIDKLFSYILKNSSINVRFARPIDSKLVERSGLAGSCVLKSPIMANIRIKGYRDISTAISRLIEAGAFIASVDYAEPLLEDLYTGGSNNE